MARKLFDVLEAIYVAGGSEAEWLGRTLDYLPVRLRITEAGGDTVEHDLVTAWARPTPVAPPAPQAPPAGPPAAGTN